MNRSPRIVMAGNVSFSRLTLEALLRHGANVVGILGLAESAAGTVSDYARLDDIAHEHGIPYRDFTKINADDVVELVKSWKPDVLFGVGLSQLLSDTLLSIPAMGSVGLHPTKLPTGRGRAPVSWLTYDSSPGAANFFVLERDADAGAIFVSEPFDAGPRPYAQDVVNAVREAVIKALDRWLPSLLAGEWNPVPQDHSKASFWGRRAPEDGCIDWSSSASEIERLVRAASRPYPGAYTYFRDRKLVIWRASESDLPFRGVIARIQNVWPDGSFLVQTGLNLIRVEEYEWADGSGRPNLQPGQRLGYVVEDEIAQLKARIAELEKR